MVKQNFTKVKIPFAHEKRSELKYQIRSSQQRHDQHQVTSHHASQWQNLQNAEDCLYMEEEDHKTHCSGQHNGLILKS